MRTGTSIVGSMGASGRLDPTRVRVGDLMNNRVCSFSNSKFGDPP